MKKLAWGLSLIVLLLAGCASHPKGTKDKLCLSNGILMRCTNPQFEALRAQNLKNQQVIQRCKKQGLDWAGGNQCCPKGFRQIGCVANLPCRCEKK